MSEFLGGGHPGVALQVACGSGCPLRLLSRGWLGGSFWRTCFHAKYCGCWLVKAGDQLETSVPCHVGLSAGQLTAWQREQGQRQRSTQERATEW